MPTASHLLERERLRLEDAKLTDAALARADLLERLRLEDAALARAEAARLEEMLLRAVIEYTREGREFNVTETHSKPGGTIPDSVSAAILTTYGVSANNQLQCVACGYKNGDHHEATKPTPDGGVRLPEVSRAHIQCSFQRDL